MQKGVRHRRLPLNGALGLPVDDDAANLPHWMRPKEYRSVATTAKPPKTKRGNTKKKGGR